MSRTGKSRALVLSAMLAAGLSLPACAQYVGHVDANQDSNKPTLRATAVLEYTGDLSKPTVSRLVPIAVWDGERYQPGAVYLADPVPLTVQHGTQYVLQVAGTPKGLFDVNAATNVQGSWIAIGTFQKPAPPNYAKLRRSRTLPRIVVDDDKPHFAHVPAGDTSPGSASAKNSQPSSQPNSNSNAPDVDPERPTLHRRADDGSSQSTSDKGDSQSTSTNSTASTSTANADPDRPTLHRDTHSAPASAGENETATTATDPNRPRLEYGRPKELESLDAPSTVEIAKLAHTPDANIEQIAAVSDPANRQPHSYVYSWNDPGGEKKAQAAIESVAQQLLAKAEQTSASLAAHEQSPRTRSPRSSRLSRRKAAAPALPALPPALSDEQFKAYELSYGGGATYIFSATSGEGDATRYITLIAQPDFSGTPRVLFKQITSQRDLDVIPRMKLVDAVDTDADNRAELVFALENTTGRQYAIYRVANGTAEQVFVTGG